MLKSFLPTRAGLHQALYNLRWPLGGGLLVVSAVFWLALINPDGTDFRITLRPAILDLLLQGKSPYLSPAFFSPPWALLPIIPYAFLPPRVAYFALALTTLVVFGLVANKLGAKSIPLALLLISPPVINVAHNGQIDWFVPLGLLLPRPIGLLLIMAKPQLGLGIAAYWLWDSWRAGGWRKVLLDFGPTVLAFAASFAYYGNYLGAGAMELTRDYITWNVSAWPYSIPIGVVLLVSALRRRHQGRALMAGPFFSPYVAVYSMSVPLLGLVDDQWVMAAACASLWAVHWLTVL